LRPELARIVAEYYLAFGNWDLAKERILSTNALQCRTSTSAIRLERELRQRLGRLTVEQLTLLTKSNAEDRAAIAWLAACKHIRFAYEFAAEVLREKLEAHDPVLRPSDYESYVEGKGLYYPELTQLTNSSKVKIRQVLLSMLAEADLLTKGGGSFRTIQRPALSPTIVRVIASDNPHWLAGFLVPESEIASLKSLQA
jgi:hypothetical protein